MRVQGGWFGGAAIVLVMVSGSGCGSTQSSNGAAGSPGSAGKAGAAAGGASAGSALAGEGGAADPGAGTAGASHTGEGGDAAGGSGPGVLDDVPVTCEGATLRSHYGCEFWPTIVTNPVWTEFSPGLAFANPGMEAATVVVTGPAGFEQTLMVAAGASSTLELAWVPELKGPEWSRSNTSGALGAVSMRVDGAAYRVESSVPIAVWQFNTLDIQLPAVDCSSGTPGGCRGASGDASLLLPTTALTGNYRVLTLSTKNEGDSWGSGPSAFALTATRDATSVTLQLPPKCGFEKFPTSELGACTAPGDGIEQKAAGAVYSFTMNAGDVLQLVGAVAPNVLTKNADLSGTVVNASQPVQVISFNAAANLPDYSVANRDHVEETTPPAETFGKSYVVMPPSNPLGNSRGHVVRIYGNVDGTQLSYPGGKPTGAPDVINAGEVVQIPPLPPIPGECMSAADQCLLKQPFAVTGSDSFAVASFLVGGTLQIPGTDSTNASGDPAGTWVQAPVQFRKRVTVFVIESTAQFLDVLAPKGAAVLIDGAPPGSEVVHELGDWVLWRQSVTGGLHEVETEDARGLSVQVTSHTFASSYYYPGGTNLKLISPPPVIIP